MQVNNIPIKKQESEASKPLSDIMEVKDSKAETVKTSFVSSR